MSTTRALVIIPGSFASSDMYDPVVLPLREKGHSIHVLDPPCYPKNYKKGTPPPSMYDDAKFVNDFVTELAGKGVEVVLLAHSYGGIPATESLKGVTKKEREEAGKEGGVVRIAYLTALAPRVGESLMDVIKGGALPMEVDEDGWLRQTSPPEIAALCFNSIPPSIGTAHAAKFGRHSATSFANALTHAGYANLPVSWFFCEDDKCVSPEVQQTAIDAIEESWQGTDREGQKVDVTRVMCDHVPIYSAREELEKWMEKLIE